jgi:hypothetical protein
MLVEDFEGCVLKDLDRVSRQAVENQEKIDDPRTFALVKKSIEDKIVTLLLEHTDNTAVPSQAFFKKVVITLANKYPYMFLEDPTTEVNGMQIRKFDQRGAGGILGVDHIPRSLSQKYRRIIDKMNTKQSGNNENVEEGGPKKRVRVSYVYGVDQSKFNSARHLQLDNNLVEHLETLSSPEEREEIFDSNRDAVQKLLTSSVDMYVSVPGFFDDQRHVRKQYEWLTNSAIVEKMSLEIPIQFGYLKLVLNHLCNTKDFRLRADAAKLKCAEQDGSSIPENVFYLRELTQLWHGNRCGLIRTPEEERSSSPHIVYLETTHGYR